MKEPTYRDALSHGWYLMTQHKILWIFGLFAALLGQMGVLEIVTKVIVTAKYYTYYPFFANFSKFFDTFVTAMKQWHLPFDQGLWFVWLLVILVAFAIGFIFVGVVCQGALIHSVAQYVRGKTKLAHHESWHIGIWHFWRLFSLQIIKKLIVGMLVFFVGFSTYYYIINPTVGNTTTFSFSILVALFLGSIVSLLVTYAAGYVVVEEYHVRGALEGAWSLLRRHSLVSVEIAVITLLVNVLAGMLATIAVIFFRIELALLLFVSLTIQSFTLWTVGNTLSAIVLTLAFIAIGSFVSVFNTTVWTYLFMKMHKEGIVPRIKMLFSRSRT